MADLGSFDSRTIDTSNTIPEGEYVVAITESEKKTSKKSGSDYLQLKLQVIDGPRKGFTLFHVLNMWHEKEQTRSISQKQLATICNATGVHTPKDSSQLHQIPFIAKVKNEPDDNNELRTVCKSFKEKAKAGSVPAPFSVLNPFTS